MGKIKIFLIVIALVLVSGLVWYGYSFYAKSTSQIKHTIDAIPENAAFIIEYKSMNDLNIFLKADTGLVSNFLGNQQIEKITSLIDLVTKSSHSNPALVAILQNSPVFVSSHFMGLDKFDYLFSIGQFGDLNLVDVESHLKEFGSVSKHSIDGSEVLVLIENASNNRFYVSINQGVLSVSQSSVLMQKVLFMLQNKVQPSNDALVAKMLKLGGQTQAHIYFNHLYFYRFVSQFAPNFREEVKKISAFAQLSEFDVVSKNDLLVMSGYSIFSDSNQSLCKVISRHSAVDVTHFKVLPINTVFLMYQSAKDWLPYHLEKKAVFSTSSTSENSLLKEIGFSVENQLFSWVNGEVSLSASSTSNGGEFDFYSILSTTDGKEASQQLNLLADKADLHFNTVPDTTSYRGFKIRNIAVPQLLESLFGDMWSVFQNHYFVEIDQYIIFANSSESLKRYIDYFLLEQFLTENVNFKSFSNYRSSRMNLFFYADMAAFDGMFSSFFTIEDSLKASIPQDALNVGFISLEVSGEENGAYTSIVVGSSQNKDLDASDNVGWQKALDANIYSNPYIMVNHQTNKREVLVFDNQNFLYRIGDNGHIHWKIPILEPPMSAVVMVDFYKNGKYQYIFNTANYIYVVDLNGNRVDNYPFKLPYSATGSLSLMDYDNRLDYRILIPLADGKLHNFTLDARPTEGWTLPEFSENHLTPVRHYRLGNKDFLLFADTLGNVVFANRRGESRMEAKLAFTNNPSTDFYQIKDNGLQKLITTDLLGRLIKIDANGNVEKSTLVEKGTKHFFLVKDFDFDGANDLVFVNDQKLSVYSLSGTLIFDSLYADVNIKAIFPINKVLSDSVSLLFLNESNKSIGFITPNGVISTLTDIRTDKSFLIDEATKNEKIRLLTSNNHILSNYLIK
ncbi:MAG: DUF3352 domain-containing protein [Bacteroidales bacterium]|nr:DUF3352 domain-containing protein [Bacteroidales bacterium]